MGRLSVQESSSPGQPPARDAPEERGARTRGGLSGDPGKEEAACPLPGTGDPVTWARRTKMRSAPDPAPLELTKLVRNRGVRECSNPERFAHGQRRTAQFAYAETRRRQPRSWEVAWDSSREEPHERGSPRKLTLAPGKERDLAQSKIDFSVREPGERSRRIRKAFVRRQRRKREPEGGPDRRPGAPTGKPP